MKPTYSAILRQSRAKLGWVAGCPERKKSAFGNTPEEALEKLKEAIKIDSFALMKFAILSECEQARRNLRRKPHPTQEWELYRLYRGEELWCDSELLKLLNQCSAQKNCTTWNQWCGNPKNNNLTVWLQGVKLKSAYLEDARLEDIHFESAELENANFKNATLNSAFFSKLF